MTLKAEVGWILQRRGWPWNGLLAGDFGDLLADSGSGLQQKPMFCRPGCQFWLALTRCFRYP